VTRRLVRLLGGDVLARSTVGAGSCFTIRMPRAWWGTTDATHVPALEAAREEELAAPPA
jgi:hypothetical protein